MFDMDAAVAIDPAPAAHEIAFAQVEYWLAVDGHPGLFSAGS